MEDPVPATDRAVCPLANATTTPIATGEDIYLKENFMPLFKSGGIAVVHPDVLSRRWHYGDQKIGDLAEDHGVAMAIHMAESPIACMAAVHVAAATRNFTALEVHSVDVPWWEDLVAATQAAHQGRLYRGSQRPRPRYRGAQRGTHQREEPPQFPEP